jgi:hypothetical protein
MNRNEMGSVKGIKASSWHKVLLIGDHMVVSARVAEGIRPGTYPICTILLPRLQTEL